MPIIDPAGVQRRLNLVTHHVDAALAHVVSLDIYTTSNPANEAGVAHARRDVRSAMRSLDEVADRLPGSQRSGVSQMLLDLGTVDRSMYRAAEDLAMGGALNRFGDEARNASRQLSHISGTLHGAGIDGVLGRGWSTGAKVAAVGGVVLLGGLAAAAMLRDR